MYFERSSCRFLKSAGRTRVLLFTAALAGMLSISASGSSNAHSQPKARQLASKAGEAFIKVTSPARDEVWEKGKTYAIQWESKGIRGNVKIVLLVAGVRPIVKAGEAKAFEIAKNVINNGSYDFPVPASLAEGAYRVQVMTVDGSIKGASRATISVRGQKQAAAEAVPRPEQAKAASARKSGAPTAVEPPGKTTAAQTPTGTAAASAKTTAATGKTAPTATTPAKGASTSVAVAGKTLAAPEKIVRGQVQSVKVSEAALNKFQFQKSAVSAPEYQLGGHSASGGKIEVSSPKDGDIWEAEKEYLIRWNSTGITGDVKIALAYGLVAGGKRTEYPIAERTADTGSYRFRVPRNWFPQNHPFHVHVSTLDGSVGGFSPGGIHVFTQYVDVQCMIMEPGIWEQKASYVFYGKTNRWFEFNVWWRNQGTSFVNLINPVMVRIVKEPEQLVCYQEEWGVSGVYPYAWYQLPEPRRFDIESWKSSWGIDFDEHVDLEKGAYRVEVELDTHNSLGEDQRLRENNKAVVRWRIK
jgi:hypothetical protein